MGHYSFNSLKEQIRAANPIEEIARQYLGEYHGVRPTYLCPFHNEQHASFTMHPSGEFFKCFGCGKVVDVFALVMFFEKIDFKNSLEYLAKRAGLPIPYLSKEDQEKLVVEMETKNKQAVILEKTFQIIKNKETVEGRKYLVEKRGIPEQIINEYEIFGSNLTLDKIQKELLVLGEEQETINQSGILADSRFFEKSLLIFIRERGQIVTICSRTLENREPKYLYLSNHPKGIFNLDHALGEKEIFVCEAPIDAATLIGRGFKGAISVGGCKASGAQIEVLKHLSKGGEVYICFDNDADKKENPGLSGAIELSKLVKSKIIILPSLGDIKEDINIYFASSHTAEDFLSLKESAGDVVEVMISTYPPNLPKLRLKETLSPLFDYILTLDEIDATNYIRHALAPHFQLTSKEITDYLKHLAHLRKEKKKAAENLSVAATTEVEEKISDDDKMWATSMLKSPILLNQVLNFVKKLGVVGEESNILIHYIILTSRITDKPLSAVVKGESSVGKSFTLAKVMQMFPQSAYRDISDATAQSFYYVAKDYFANKIIVVFERHGQEKTDYSIRTFQSEKKLKLQVVVKDPKTGQFVTQVKEVDGPAGFVTTTTEAHIHNENETRVISIFPDETPEQTYRTFEATDAEYRGINPVDKDEIKKWQAIQTIIKSYRVWIPYVEEIRKRFPTSPSRVRRDYGKLLAFISVVVLLHQEQREKVVLDGRECLKAALADYHITKLILEDTLVKTIYEIPPKSGELVHKAKELIDKGVTGITIRELSQELNWDYDTAKKWSDPAIQKGYFIVAEEHKGPIAAKYTVSTKKLDHEHFLPSTEELAEINPDWLGSAPLYDPITGDELKVVNEPSTDVPIAMEPDKNTHDDNKPKNQTDPV